MLNRTLLDRLAARRALADACDYPDVRKRREGLKRLLKLLVGHRENVIGALRDDLGKSEFETATRVLLYLGELAKQYGDQDVATAISAELSDMLKS